MSQQLANQKVVERIVKATVNENFSASPVPYFVIRCLVVAYLCSATVCCWGQADSTASIATANSDAVGQTVNDRLALKNYLKSHELYQLYGELLEEELLGNTDENARKATATELAKLYAWQLNTRPGRFESLSTRLDELAREFPQAIPLATQINIGYGRYRQAKKVFEDWIWDRRNPELTSQVESRFVNVVQRATDALARFEQELQDEQLNPGLRRELETGVSQFRYLAGWARYYRGIAMNDPERSNTLLLAAEQDFLDLLEVADSDVLIRMSPQWWSLNSDFTCRLLLGLGMTNQALERAEKAEFCFNLLTESRVPNSIRESQRVWRFHSFIFPDQIEQADLLVRKWEPNLLVRTGPNREVADDIPLWSAVTIAGISRVRFARNNPENSSKNDGGKTSQNLVRVGLMGLAKANEFLLMDEIHARYPGVTVKGDDFFARWMHGYSILKLATDQTKNSSVESSQTVGIERSANLSQAIEQLNEALRSAANIDPVFRARCRYHLGFAEYSARNFEQAADQFDRASTVLRSLDPALAEHAAWMQCQSLHRLASMDAELNQSLAFALNEYQKRYPNSPNASKAAFMQVMVQLDNQSGDQAIATLSAIRPGEANYTKALYEICRLNHQAWSQTTDDEARQQSAMATLKAAEKYTEEVGVSTASTNEKYIRICLFAADTEIQSSNVEGAQAWLARTVDLMKSNQTAPELESDFQFLQLNLASLRGDRADESRAAEWLLLNASQKNHLRAALVSRARLLDQQLKESAAGDAAADQRLFDSVIDAYQRLVEDFSSDDEYWVKDPVALTALLRLAELYAASGNAKEAKACYETLHQVSSRELAYLLGLARSEMVLQEYELAAKRWRLIASGLPVGHDSWLESKYNLVKCLMQTQTDKARSVLQQTRLLVPDMPDTWATSFDDLEQRLTEQP